MMVVSCVELLSLFIALELSSFALYLLVPMRDDGSGMRSQMESAVKYILFGVMATGVMLFGMSYLFGLTGTTYLGELLPRLHTIADQPAAIVGITMVLAGFFFKLGLFPFHFWLPDVYQGASNETTTFIAAIPKLGAVALLIRVTGMAEPAGDFDELEDEIDEFWMDQPLPDPLATLPGLQKIFPLSSPPIAWMALFTNEFPWPSSLCRSCLAAIVGAQPNPSRILSGRTNVKFGLPFTKQNVCAGHQFSNTAVFAPHFRQTSADPPIFGGRPLCHPSVIHEGFPPL